MLVPVKVRMSMDSPGFVRVQMRVQKAGLLEQRNVAQNLRGRAFRHDAPLLKDAAYVGNIFGNIEVMGGGDNGFRASFRAHKKVNHVTFAFGIESGGRFIEQQDFRIEHQD